MSTLENNRAIRNRVVRLLITRPCSLGVHHVSTPWSEASHVSNPRRTRRRTPAKHAFRRIPPCPSTNSGMKLFCHGQIISVFPLVFPVFAWELSLSLSPWRVNVLYMKGLPVWVEGVLIYIWNGARKSTRIWLTFQGMIGQMREKAYLNRIFFFPLTLVLILGIKITIYLICLVIL